MQEVPSHLLHALKIALVTETFPPEINGVAMTLQRLVGGLAQRGHEVTVLRPRQGAADAPTGGVWREELFPSLPIPGYAFLRLGLPARRRLAEQWRRQRPDLVHVATEGPLGYSAIRAARALGLPVSSSFHTNFHAYSRYYGIGFLTRAALAYLRHFHNRTLATFAPTAELNQQLARSGFARLRLLARGVDTALFSPTRRREDLRAQWGLGPDDLAVVHVSRLAAEKNYPLLFAAFAAIRAAQPRAKLVLVSDGPLRRKLQRAHSEAHFTGFLEAGALAEHYASSDLFLYPSLTETFGNVVLEAMASGLPVAAFNYAAAARFIRHGENGWLVPFGDRRAFLAGAQTLSADAALRRRLGAAARAAVETVPWEGIVAGFERDLLELVQLAPQPLPPAPQLAPC
ncbi:MAG TPA: glycosyltransferase family 1 protein [Opitutaceae bacterium]|nr:glycosyltransferase family 1 protein [Opitutaceae bacterium]